MLREDGMRGIIIAMFYGEASLHSSLHALSNCLRTIQVTSIIDWDSNTRNY